MRLTATPSGVIEPISTAVAAAWARILVVSGGCRAIWVEIDVGRRVARSVYSTVTVAPICAEAGSPPTADWVSYPVGGVTGNGWGAHPKGTACSSRS